MAIDQERLMQSVYDTIYDALTARPAGVGGGQPIEDRNQSYLSLAFPGNAVDVAQFANAWSPDNTQGSVYAAENFASLVDAVPLLSARFTGSGESVDNLYGEVVNANVSPPPRNASAEREYNRAFDTLYVDGVDFDDQGRQVRVKVDAPIYRNYKNKKAIYNAALLSYLTHYLQYDLSQPGDQRRWSVLAPTLQAPVDAAWNDLQAARPGVVESSLATLGQYEASNLSSIFTRARQTYEMTRRGSVVQPGLFWHHCEAFPGNWFADSASANFTQFTVESERLRINEQSRFSSFSGGGSVGFGLWRVGGSFSSSSQRYDLSTETTRMRISFKLGRVEIRRRWMNPSLYSLQGWAVAGRGQNAYSTGQIQGNDGIFPLLPTSFIVARDIQISASWGSSDLHYAAQSTSSSVSVGWGPFSLSGSYQNSSSSRTFESSFDGTTIAAPGIQIIGWISRVLPASPPDSGVGDAFLGDALATSARRRYNPYHPNGHSPNGESAGDRLAITVSGSRWVSAER